MAHFRESQRRIIEDYEGGMMGIAAVPGSGKTFTLSHLAARLVSKVMQSSQSDAEVLIVTFSNSAVNSFKKKIAKILEEEYGMLPFVGYRVRTLHGLAHDVVRERPALLGLAEDFQILDERVSLAILRDVVFSHLSFWQSRLLEAYENLEMASSGRNKVIQHDFPNLLQDITARFIKQAKNQRYTSDELQHKITEDSPLLLRFAVQVYADYQRTLSYRNAVDFDDLVVYALQALQTAPDYLARLQTRWEYILEDEAQDSSFLQEEMLRLLTGERNWVRVGDPNQAINTTFTTSDPFFLRQFLANPSVLARDLPTSGRCGIPILALANELVGWTIQDHPQLELRSSFYPQAIQATASDDPQQNPSVARIHIHYDAKQKVTSDNEIALVLKSLRQSLAEHPEETVALLVPENSRGYKLGEALRAEGIICDELLRSTLTVRQAAQSLCLVLAYLANPNDTSALSRVFGDVWWDLRFGDDDLALRDQLTEKLRKVRRVEDLLYPFVPTEAPAIPELDDSFIAFIRFSLEALILPIDQLILTISQRLFMNAIDIALSYKLAGFLKTLQASNPAWGLADYVGELRAISENQRRFIGFEDSSEGYEPKPGIPTIATVHASKGLEWDRVYLLGVNTYSFPSLEATDSYLSERWFIRDSLNLDAELLAQLRSLMLGDAYREGEATARDRVLYCAERLRLFYVGITRAKSSLIITWNTGRFGRTNQQKEVYPSVPLLYLKAWLGS